MCLLQEFFRAILGHIREQMVKLEQGKDFNGSVTWTEKAKAQQYYDSLNIEKDPSSKEKWLNRTRLIAERRQRFASKLSFVEDDEAAVGVKSQIPEDPIPVKVGSPLIGEAVNSDHEPTKTTPNTT